jgi:hypothetical protein
VVPYVAGVRRVLDEASMLYGAAELLVEAKVEIEPGLVYGTLDAAVITSETLDVIDLKSGEGKVVHADEWVQGRTYAVGLCLMHKWRFQSVRLHIGQAANDDAEGLEDAYVEREKTATVTGLPMLVLPGGVDR